MQYFLVKRQAVLLIEKTGGLSLNPARRCIGFLDENLERGFLTTLGLLLLCLGAIFSAKISLINRV